MNRFLLRASACLFAVVLLVAAAAIAELTPAQKQEVDALIRQFADDDMKVRQKAVEKVVEIGPEAAPIVRKAMDQAKDEEVKYRCEQALRGLVDKWGTGMGPSDVPAPLRVNLEASRITLDVKDATIAEVFKSLAQQSSNPPLVVPQNMVVQKLTLAIKDVPYWQAVDAVIRQAKLACEPDFGSGGLSVRVDDGARDIAAYPGPVVVKVAYANSYRSFEKPAGTLRYELLYLYEDRLPVVSVDAWATKASAADGTPLVVPERQKIAPLPIIGCAPAPGGRLSVELLNVPEKATSLAMLQGTISLQIGLGEKNLNMGNVLKPGEKSAVRDGLRLTVTNVAPADEWLVLTFRAERAGAAAPMPIRQPTSRFGYFLLDGNGKRYSGAILPAQIALRPNYINQIVKDRKPVTVFFGGQDSDSYNVYFFGLPRNPGTLTFVYVYPERTVTQEYTFRFENVPLP